MDEAIVEVIVIVAMPNIVTTLPCSGSIIPRKVTTAALPSDARRPGAEGHQPRCALGRDH